MSEADGNFENITVVEIKIEDGIEEGNDANPERDYINNEPFNPNEIKISSKVVAVETIRRRLLQKTLNINPEFQRNFVWDIARKSQLIESMILKIPLPMFYVAEDSKGNWEVVDGLQRLSTLREFILGPDNDGKGFKLEKLEFLTEINGNDFFTLREKLKANTVVNNILDTEFYFTVINSDTPERFKRTIFQRLNTGGMQLHPQEIRHAIYEGPSTKLLKDLVGSREFLNSTCKSVNDKRMAGRELILRFFAFYFNDRMELVKLKSKFSVDDLLANTMKFMNLAENKQVVDKGAEAFKLGAKRSQLLFGEHAYRTSTPFFDRRAAINKSLFEVWINILAVMDDKMFLELQKNRNKFYKFYADLLEDYDFSTSISRYAGSASGAKTRYEKIVNLLTDEMEIKVV